MEADHSLILSAAHLQAARWQFYDESADQFEDLAASFENSNNREVATVFQACAERARGLAAAMGQRTPLPGFAWHVYDPGDPEAVHYLMKSYHALALALDNCERASAFFMFVSAQAADEALARLAFAAAEIERLEAEALRERLQGAPLPASDWDDDPDPPNWDQ